MAMNVNINVKTKAKMARESLHELSNSFVSLGRDSKRANISMNAFAGGLGKISTLIKGVGLYKLSQGLATAMQSAMDTTESIHMYNVAMGEFAESTGLAVTKLSELSGLDRVKMLDTVGEYNLLARSMGITSENASVLSENTNRLALDLGALTNRSFTKVAEDLRSGLIGQSKTMYKYGIDVTEASVKQEALNQGIKKSVRHMSQGEKMALRYAVMVRQTSLYHGDFANTINKPANQLRILSERFVTLSRTVGNLFLPMVREILPWLNAMTQMLTRMVDSMSVVFGGKKMGENDDEAIENTINDFGALGDEMDEDGKKADKLKKKIQALAGFDELNILGSKDKDKDKDEDDFSFADMKFPKYDSGTDAIVQKSDEILKKMEKKLQKLMKFLEPTINAFKKLWHEGLKKLMDFGFKNLMNFYNSFLKPLSKWVVGPGLIRFFEITNDLLNKIDWKRLEVSIDNLYKALLPFGIAIGTGLLDFYEYVLVPIGEWIMNSAIIDLNDAMTNGLEQIDFEKINGGFITLWEALAPFAITIGEGLVWFFENVLVPLSVWTITKVLPEFLEIFANVLKILTGVITANKPNFEWLWDNFLLPIAQWVGTKIIEDLENINWVLGKFSEWIDENQDKVANITLLIAGFFLAFQVGNLLSFIGMAGGVSEAFVLIAKAVAGGKIAVAIGGIIDGLETIYIKSLYAKDGFKLLFSGIGSGFETLQIAYLLAIDGIKTFFIGVGTAIGGVLTTIATGLGLTVAGLFGLVAFVLLFAFAVYQLVENYDEVIDYVSDQMLEFKETCAEIGRNIVKFFTDIGDGIVEWWDGMIDDISDAFLKWDTWLYDQGRKFVATWDGVVQDFKDGWKGMVEKNSEHWARFKRTHDERVDNMKTKWGEFTDKASEGWGKMVDRIKTGLDRWQENIEKFGENALQFFKDLPENMAQIGEDMIKGLFDGISRMNQWFKDKLAEWFGPFFSEMFGLNDIKVGAGTTRPNGPRPYAMNVPQYARGGMPQSGSIFMAGEAGAELLGSHKGQTTVMPLEDSGFVQAMSGAVYSAVVNAMMASGGNDNNDNGGIVVNIGERTIVDTVISGINRQNRINGRTVINV